MKTLNLRVNKKYFTLAFLLSITAIFLHAQGTGILDASFGKNGKVFTKISSNRDDIAQSIAVTPDNKIVIGVNSFNIIGYSNIAIVRYKANGALDKTFNSTGKRIINNAFCNVVAVQPDKKIVIGGSVAIGSSTVFGLWRLNANGSNDNSFGTNGYQTVAFSGYVICFAMKLQNDGKILIGGNDGNFYAGNSSLILARLNTNGQLDNSFSADGKFSLNLTRKSLTCNEILIQPDGKIIATGQLDTVVRPNFINEFFATRLNSNGSIDSSFGNNGMTRAKNSTSDIAYCAGLLPGGNIIMGGYSKLSGLGNKASALGLTGRGLVDNTFGTNGWAYPSFFGATAVLNAAIVQANSKIIFAGDAYDALGISSAGVTRLNSDGTQDVSFACNGVDTISKAGSSLVCNDAAFQKDGKFIITGNTQYSTDTLFTARFLNDQQIAIVQTQQSPSAKSMEGFATVYPDPVTTNLVQVNLNLAERCKLTIDLYNLNGIKMLHWSALAKEAGTSTETIVLPNTIVNGTYVMLIDNGKESKSIKIVVAK